MEPPLPKEIEDEFHRVIGGIIIRFGFIDTLISNICHSLFVDLGGHSSQKETPRNMSVRLRYIGKCFRHKPVLHSLRDDMERLCQQVREVDKHRNFIVHGCLTQFFPFRNAFEFTKLDTNADNSGYNFTSAAFTYQELVDIAQTSSVIISGLANVGKCLIEIVTTQNSDKDL